MALFTKLREKVTGAGLKFDNLENIAKKEDENAMESDLDNAFLARHSKSISVFNKEKTTKFTNEKSSSSLSRENNKFVNVFPTDNNENIYPSQIVRPMEAGTGGLEKKPSFLTLNKQLQKEEAVSQMTPRVELRTESGSSQDNRFATSRSVSFRGVTSAPSIASFVPTAPTESLKSQSKEEEYEEVHEYSDEDVDELDISQQDRIEMVFSKARHNHIDEVLAAIQNGFNVNTKDVYGNTIIHVCAQNNRKKLAATLLQRFPQCNMHAENHKHFTPVDYAEKYGFAGMATWLRDTIAQNESQAARNVSKFR